MKSAIHTILYLAIAIAFIPHFFHPFEAQSSMDEVQIMRNASDRNGTLTMHDGEVWTLNGDRWGGMLENEVYAENGALLYSNINCDSLRILPMFCDNWKSDIAERKFETFVAKLKASDQAAR